MLKPGQKPSLWVAVGDGRQFQIYTREPITDPTMRQESWTLRALSGMHFVAESTDIYETGRKTSASVFESSNPARHMSEPHMDVHTLVKLNLVKDVGSHLKAAKQASQFDRLILIAPPEVLGLLRQHLSKEVVSAIEGELAKNLVGFDARALKDHLGDLIPV